MNFSATGDSFGMTLSILLSLQKLQHDMPFVNRD